MTCTTASGIVKPRIQTLTSRNYEVSTRRITYAMRRACRPTPNTGSANRATFYAKDSALKMLYNNVAAFIRRASNLGH